jgi:hypothetical protein
MLLADVGDVLAAGWLVFIIGAAEIGALIAIARAEIRHRRSSPTGLPSLSGALRYRWLIAFVSSLPALAATYVPVVLWVSPGGYGFYALIEVLMLWPVLFGTLALVVPRWPSASVCVASAFATAVVLKAAFYKEAPHVCCSHLTGGVAMYEGVFVAVLMMSAIAYSRSARGAAQ